MLCMGVESEDFEKNRTKHCCELTDLRTVREPFRNEEFQVGVLIQKMQFYSSPATIGLISRGQSSHGLSSKRNLFRGQIPFHLA